MRINTNVSALNAANNLGRVQAEASESMAKLSSGFRINKAADDAAGLGIANKLRADGRALSQASRNAEQTNSLLQVAEGSTSTIQKMLERMKELATQSGSDTVDAAGRGRINAEFTALRSEIDRTVSTTKFQGNALLDGSFGTIANALTTGDFSYTAGGTAAVGAYSLTVSNAGVATLSGPAGRSDQVDITTLTTADYSGGKVTLAFGAGATQIKVAVTADSANDISSVKAALDTKGFSIAAGTAATHTGAQVTPQAGVTIGTIGSAIADGDYTIVGTDRTSTKLGNQAGVTLGTIGTSVAAGTYTVAVTNASAALGSAVAGVTFAASGVPGGAKADAYQFAVDTAAHSITIKDSLGNSVASQTFLAGSGGTDGDAISFSNNGFTFSTVSNGGTTDTWANIKTALEGAQRLNVTAAKIDVKDGSNAVVATQNLTAGYSGAADITFSNANFAFTVDHLNANVDTYAEMKAALGNTSIKVDDAKIEVKNASNTVIAAQTYAAYTSGSTLSFSQGAGATAINFSVSAGTNTSFSAASTALAASPLRVSSTAAGANSVLAGSITGNSTVKQANFLVDSSGAYRSNDQIQLSAIDLTVSTLGLSASDLSTSAGALTALSKIDSAISTVSSALGSIGANQNRISYAQDNLKTKINNFSAAESVIRDVDMADEMTKFSKSNILAQAGTAMLAQANQAAQGVLQLLRG